MPSDFSGDISVPKSFAVFCCVNSPLSKPSSEPAIVSEVLLSYEPPSAVLRLSDWIYPYISFHSLVWITYESVIFKTHRRCLQRRRGALLRGATRMHVSPAVRCSRQKKKKIINVSLREGWSSQDLSSDRWGGRCTPYCTWAGFRLILQAWHRSSTEFGL